MKLLVGAIAVVSCIYGCEPDNSMTKEEIARVGHTPRPTAAQFALMGSQMARGAAAAVAQQKAWANTHRDMLAEVNKARAKGGKPPITP